MDEQAHWQTGGWIDGRTDRHRQTGGRTDEQTRQDSPTDEQTDRRMDGQTQIDGQMDWQMDEQAHIRSDRRTDGRTKNCNKLNSAYQVFWPTEDAKWNLLNWVVIQIEWLKRNVSSMKNMRKHKHSTLNHRLCNGKKLFYMEKERSLRKQ